MIEPKQDAADEVKSASDKKKFSKLRLVILFFAAVAVIIGGCMGVDTVVTKLANVAKKADAALVISEQLQIRNNQLQSSLEELQAEVQKLSASTSNYWRPMVVSHLIHLADLTLNTTGDVKLALSFLLKAKQYADGPALSKLRHALSNDIASLQIVPLADIAELVLKLESINQKIASLPMVAPEFIKPPAKESKEKSTQQDKKIWQRVVDSVVKALRELVVIRHRTVEPLPSPEQETIIRLEIQAKILQAQLAVIHRQNGLYQSCLGQVIRSISRYFVANQYTVEIISLLKELQRIDLQPQLPFPTESIAAVANLVTLANPSEFGKSSVVKSESVSKPQVIKKSKKEKVS